MDPVGLARVGARTTARALGRFAALAALAALAAHPRIGRAAANDDPSRIVTVIADRDDDDADGTPDGEQAVLGEAARIDTLALDESFVGAEVEAVSGGDLVRLVVGDRPQAWGTRVMHTGPALQGLAPGVARLVVRRGNQARTLEVHVRGIAMRDGALERVDMARSHASLERTPPRRVEGPVDAAYDDPDSLRVLVESPELGDEPAPDVTLESVSEHGVRTDVLAHLDLKPSNCVHASAGIRCLASAPIRFVIDEVDRAHPLVEARSIRAEVSGAIVVRMGGKKAQQIRVLGPRNSAVGPIAAFKATLRPFVLRLIPGGAPAIGGTDSLAIEAIRSELGAAAAIWGQCGLSFGDPKTQEVKVVDPPPSHLIAIGDGLGVPAAGASALRLRVDGASLSVPIATGASPDRVARELAAALERLGFVAIVSPNARIGPGAFGSVDVSVRRRDGAFAVVDAASPGAPLTEDEALVVRIGSVDLSDGLQHFTDTDAMAGTLEERTILKAFDDGDPSTLEVVVVPMFAGGGRIGESFIGSDLSSLRNVVLLDRAGIRARRSSLTLAHELGHVLMDMPGHPDDYGVDTPTLLMDSDASDASPFGPRRITVDECARVVRQAGPNARVPLLVDLPLAPIPADTRPLIGN